MRLTVAEKLFFFFTVNNRMFREFVFHNSWVRKQHRKLHPLPATALRPSEHISTVSDTADNHSVKHHFLCADFHIHSLPLRTTQYSPRCTNASYLNKPSWRRWRRRSSSFWCSFYKVVQIWPGQTVTCLHTISPGHIWTTLYFQNPLQLHI
jgi:hypothetical protein